MLEHNKCFKVIEEEVIISIMKMVKLRLMHDVIVEVWLWLFLVYFTFYVYEES